MSPSDGPRADEPAAGDTPVTGEETEAEELPAATAAAGSVGRAATPDEQAVVAAILNEPDEPAAASGETAARSGNRRTVLVASAIAVVVLVVAGVLVYALTGNDSKDDASPVVPSIADSGDQSTSAGPGTPTGSAPPPIQSSAAPPAAGDAGAAQSVAEQAASAITSADMNTLTQLSCDPSTVGDDDTFPPDAKVEVVGEPQITGEAATVDVKVTIGEQPPATVPMPLVKQDGRWCIPG